MKTYRKTTWGVLFAFTVTTLMHSQVVSAAPPADRPATPPTTVLDVELSAEHSLAGQLLDSQGKSQAGAVVRVMTDRVRETTTDAEGRFQFTGVRAGVVRLGTDDAGLAVRCWTHGTAPPSAVKSVLLSPNEEIVRGQHPIADLLCGPVLIGLIIAAAIAIPIAIHNSKDAAS